MQLDRFVHIFNLVIEERWIRKKEVSKARNLIDKKGGVILKKPMY